MGTVAVDPASLDSIADAVLCAARTLGLSASQALSELAPGLNLTELRALTLLHLHGPLRLVDIADALDVTPTTATRIADRLTAARVVERTRLSRDRREIHLSISSSGMALVESIAEHRRRHMSAALRHSSPSAVASALEILHVLGGGAGVVAETA